METVEESLNSALSCHMLMRDYCMQAAHNIFGPIEYTVFHDFLHEFFNKEWKNVHTILDNLHGNKFSVSFPVIDVSANIPNSINELLLTLLDMKIQSTAMYDSFLLIENLPTPFRILFENRVLEEDEDRQLLQKMVKVKEF